MSRNWRLYLDDIARSCEVIGGFIAGMSFEAFVADAKTRAAVEWHLLIIGEAAKHLPDDERRRYPGVDWRKIAGLRDVLAHEMAHVAVGMNHSRRWNDEIEL